jgi:predicted RNA-binding protein Jag
MQEIIKSQITELLNLTAGSVSQINNINFQKESNQWRIILDVKNQEAFVENNFELLRSIQYIIRVAVHKVYPEDRTHFFFDVSNIRKNREQILSVRIPALTKDMVLGQGRSLILVNLSGYERLLVHQIVNEVKGVETVSVGNNKNRKLLIIPSSDVGSYNLDEALLLDLNEVSQKS